MTTIKRKLNGLTIRELKELIKDIDEDTEISVWSEIPLQKLDIEIVKYDFGDIDVDINVEYAERLIFYPLHRTYVRTFAAVCPGQLLIF